MQNWNKEMDNKLEEYDKIVSEINELVKRGKEKHGTNIWLYDRCCAWEAKFYQKGSSKETPFGSQSEEGSLNELGKHLFIFLVV